MPNIVISPVNTGTVSSPALTVADTSLPGTCLVQKSDGSTNFTPAVFPALPSVTVYTSTADAVTFANAYNVAIFTSIGPDLATLATPVAGDNGKVLVLINTNTTQTTVTTAANKILNGTATPGDTLTAPAHAGAVVVLYAAALFWNIAPAGTGTWVLSEV